MQNPQFVVCTICSTILALGILAWTRFPDPQTHASLATAQPTPTPKLYQRSFLFIVPVTGRPAQSLLDEHLKNGWRVVQGTSLGGSDSTHYMAVLTLERDRPADPSEPWFDERHATTDAPAAPEAPHPAGKSSPRGIQ